MTRALFISAPASGQGKTSVNAAIACSARRRGLRVRVFKAGAEPGAQVLRFAPLAGEPLPDCDALWLPGGYPEPHARALSGHAQGQSSLRHPMAAILPGHARMHERLTAIGLQSLRWPEGELRGHSFHHFSMETPLAPWSLADNPNGGVTRKALWCQGSLRASYVHHYLPSNPQAGGRYFAGGGPDGQALALAPTLATHERP